MGCHFSVSTFCFLQIPKHADDTTVFPRCFPGRTVFIFVQNWISSLGIVCSTFCGLRIKTQSLDNSINQERLRLSESFSVWKWRNVNTGIRIHSPFLCELKILRGIFRAISKSFNGKILFLNKDEIINIHQNDHIL